MPLLIDTHIHLYPCFNFEVALLGAKERLAQIDSQAQHALCLTERFDCFAFQALLTGEKKFNHLSVERLNAGEALKINAEEGGSLLLFPGRQIITQERLEVLSLTSDSFIPDGLSIRETLAKVREGGGVPVLPWSPGKWFSHRGEIVQEITDSHSPHSLLLGDVSLRPTFWLEPKLMRRARERGYKVIYGSDPLPFSGEEAQLGRYVTHYSSVLTLDDHSAPSGSPTTQLRELLLAETGTSIGSRSPTIPWAVRLLRNFLARRRTQDSSLQPS